MKENYIHTEEFQVRDTELSASGIVNNASYLVYLEHARHNYLRNLKKAYTEFLEKGITLIVVECNLKFKAPLKSGDKFWVGLNWEQKTRLKHKILQDVYHSDGTLVLEATFIASAIDKNGKPVPVKLMDE